MVITHERWVRFLRLILRCLRKDHIFIKKTWESYWLIDRQNAYALAPASTDTFTMDKDVKVPVYKLVGPWECQQITGNEAEDAEAKFMKYMAGRNWRH